MKWIIEYWRKAFATGIIILVLICSCEKPGEHGENFDRKKLMAHYAADTLKQKAAAFLLDNLPWHLSKRAIRRPAPAMMQRIGKADSVYYHITGGVNNALLRHAEMNRWIKNREEYFNSILFLWTEEELDASPEWFVLNNDFLIRHIDHAFSRWRESPFAKNLSFDEFCEYLLPFSTIPLAGNIVNGRDLFELTGKYITRSNPYTLSNVVESYTHFIRHIRFFLGERPPVAELGWFEMFFQAKRDCVPLCDLECNVLRASGIPTAIDMNIGNREYAGQHHHCVIFDTNGISYPFHGESYLSDNDEWGYALEYKLNIYRLLYGVQADSPYALRGEGEVLPDNFQHPTIKDVTAYLKKTYPLTLNWDSSIPNRLVWLYTYARDTNGIRAVTWGVVDSTGRKACFRHVIPNILYIPAYLKDNGEVCFLSAPLYAGERKNFQDICLRPVTDFATGNPTPRVNLKMTRKFPRKPNMIRLADEMVGGKFYGANQKNGSDKRELFTITTPPQPLINEYQIGKPAAYRYYIYEAPDDKRANISILEFLSSPDYGYSNTGIPVKPEVLSLPEEGERKQEYVALIPLNMNEPEYDGNMETSSGKKRIVYELQEPQMATAIRLAPKNADNGIKPYEDYELFRWEDGWKLQQSKESTRHFLTFDSLPSDGLYWLRNNSRGQEEIPFVIVNQEPRFIYYETMMERKPFSYEKLSRRHWRCTVSSEEPESGPYEPGYARFMFDGNPTTFWHSQYSQKLYKYPHRLCIDFNRTERIDGMILTPRGRDVAKEFEISVSRDGENWQQMGFFTLQNKKGEQVFYLDESKEVRFLEIELKNGYAEKPYTSIAEFEVFRERMP